MRSWFRAALVVAALVFSPAVAAAQLQLGAELEAIFPGGDNVSGDTGIGYAGRLGYAIEGPMFELVPELRIAFVNFAEPSDANRADLGLWRYTAGLRLGFGEILRPTAFAHIGYGDVTFGEPEDTVFEKSFGDQAFTWDAGVAFDLVLLPLVDLGVHGAYNRLETDRAVHWWSAGVHAVLNF